NVINTKYDEDGVFIHPDGKQIFFSSKGHNSMGGFDIFTSLVNDENGYWSTPVNYGYPVNTTDDDVFLITTADGKRAFFSSDKEGGYGEKDIYMIQFPEYEPRDITILLGNIVNKSNESIENNRLYIINTAKGDTIQSLSANSASGKFGANLPIGASYKFICTINDKEIFNEDIDVRKGKGYNVIKKEILFYGDSSLASNTNGQIKDTTTSSTSNLNDQNSDKKNTSPCTSKINDFQLFFGYNKKDIEKDAVDFATFVNELSNCLVNNSNFIIDIESSASRVPTATYRSNEHLADLRAKNAMERIEKALIKKGVKKTQIVFSKPKAMVQGPEYKKDAIENSGTYGQFQYIKIKAGPKQ
ncbi:MAG: PD40 domain-containing protein, partial [Bacteroidetes bacterium]|nr:PD40 domain-containing protein [Bacteroidota bacterium]